VKKKAELDGLEVNEFEGDKEADEGDGVEWTEAQLKSRRAMLVKVFRYFDTNDSGFIEPQEFLALGQARRTLGFKTQEWTEEQNENLIKVTQIHSYTSIQD